MPASRQRLWSTLAAGAALTVLLASCATGPDAGGAPSDPAPGGILSVGLNGWAPTKLDPHTQANSNDPLVFRAIFDTLFWQTEDGEYEGILVDDWEISDDGLVYTLHLRDGVTFHDGAEWNAEALRLNFEHIFDPETQAPLQASYLRPYESSRIVDDLTLEVTLSEPYSAFINVLAQAYIGIISPKQLTEAPETIAEHPIGSGPFQFVSWTAGESIVLERFDDYAWGPSDAENQGAAYLDGLEITFVAEDSVRYNALAAGDFDLIDWTPPQNVEAVQSNPDLEFVKFDRPGHPYALWLNENQAPTDDPLVRQALFAALDRESIIAAVSFGQWTVADGYLVPSTPNYTPNSNSTFSYDVATANELLDEAGWTERDSDGYRIRDGVRLSLSYPTVGDTTQANQILELAQDQLKDVGVEVRIEVLSQEDQRARTAAGDFNVSAGIWTTNTADVLFIKYSSTEITTPERRGTNQTSTRDAEIDRLVAAARSTTDSAERASLYADAQERLTEIVPSIPLYYRPSLVSFQSTVHGVAFDRAYGNVTFLSVWKDSAP